MKGMLKVGIIGLGKMGRIRAKEIARIPNAVVTIGADPNTDHFRHYPGVECHTTFEPVIESDVDIVFVCTPNRFTCEAVCSALDAGKHVFSEKPPGRTVDDILTIIDAEKRNPKQVLKFGFNHRYHAGIIEAKRIIESGRIGRLLWARGVYGKSGGVGFEDEWRSSFELCGGGILLDQGIHMLDLLRFFIGDFTEVKSMVTTAHWNIPLEDNAFALLRDSHGRVAMMHSSSTQWKHRFNLELYGSEGFLSVNGILSSTRSYGDETITIARKQLGKGAKGKPVEEMVYFDTDPSWELEVEEFFNCVNHARPVLHGTSEDALKAMQLVYDIYGADESWKAKMTEAGAAPVMKKRQFA